MSSIVVAPTRKAENSIYLAFSVVLVVFIQYAFAWAQGQDTGVGFVPDFALILTLSPIAAAALIYSSPDERAIHAFLKRRATRHEHEMEESVLLTMYALRLYRVTTWRLLNETFLVSHAKTTVLESGDLDSRIWRLRGAFWFVLSVPLSIAIVASMYQWDSSILSLLIVVSMVVVTMVLYPSWCDYKESALFLTNLAEFHLLDRGLSIVRRWETSTERIGEQFRFSVQGLTETIYRGIRAAKVVEKEENGNKVGKILKPLVYLSKTGGTERAESRISIEQKPAVGVDQGAAETARFHDLVDEECEWLRELVRRESWAAFRMRFLDLRTQITGRGKIALGEIVIDLVKEWANALKVGTVTHAFAQLRALCYKMTQYALIPDGMVAVVEKLLRYHDSHMIDRAWVFHYWPKLMEKHLGDIVPIVYDAFQSIPAESIEDELKGEDLGDKFHTMEKGKEWFGKPSVTLDDSERMTYGN